MQLFTIKKRLVSSVLPYSLSILGNLLPLTLPPPDGMCEEDPGPLENLSFEHTSYPPLMAAHL